ncbi:Fe-S protein assembly co-chaperone HscB [Undibacterium sp. Jales W-56]|uniref:Fe-S protein assembly co-chaperone HscB n=1 Tax=Undibacterium sp. Jales W-56 TaxID=2897325 RepID=UPI0021D21234|nr:Fe-S protein assembly co-chaperone HscB [Undibacterium sp. Jales W-56]MCU6433757.1 Fe-S protein assembly co-chaperone HscB [Undibacterium sp. Jales W-56]
MQNHFELFQLPQQFALDQAKLDTAYREVQGKVHPDKFVQASDAEKRVAMQWATRANEAYQTLKKPLKRAKYLCELQGVDLQTESNTSMPAAFLMQQMEWREAFDDARQASDVQAMDQLENELRAALKQQLDLVGTTLDMHDYRLAAQQIRACMFLEKFIADISDIAALED